MDPKILGETIRKYRIQKQLSQNALAERLSVTAQSVSKWECGRSVPDLQNLCRLADLLEIPVNTLLNRKKEQKQVMAAIDGGGSKTEFVLFDDSWKLLDRLVLGACNPNSVGEAGCLSVLETGLNRLLTRGCTLKGIYLGASGFGISDLDGKILARLRKLYPETRIACSNDILNVIASVPDTRDCIAVICGTGSIVYARAGDSLTRLTGWGYLLSRSGSGFDIGRDAVYAALQHREGLGPETSVTGEIEAWIGGPVEEKIVDFYGKDQSYLASFAPVVLDGFRKGDKVCREILEENSGRLAEVINFAAKKFRCGPRVILSGGLFTGDPTLGELVGQKLLPELSPVIPKNPQVYGACVLCAQMCGVSTEGSEEKFLQQYQTGEGLC